jgi:hypothetical protein
MLKRFAIFSPVPLQKPILPVKPSAQPVKKLKKTVAK